MEQSPPEFRLSAGHYLFTYGIVVLLGLLLAGSLRLDEVVSALIVGGVVTALAAPRLSIMAGVRLSPRAPIALLSYLAVFFVALVKANLDMARRVLSPSLPIHPAVVEVRTGLKSALGKLLLANSITLTPGTLSVDVRDDRVLVHWVDSAPGVDIDSATRAIAKSFEHHLSGFVK